MDTLIGTSYDCPAYQGHKAPLGIIIISVHVDYAGVLINRFHCISTSCILLGVAM